MATLYLLLKSNPKVGAMSEYSELGNSETYNTKFTSFESESAYSTSKVTILGNLAF